MHQEVTMKNKQKEQESSRENSSGSHHRFRGHIPHDVTLLVLARLPAKSLMIFKSVCKLWHSTNPQFAELHLSFSLSRNGGMFFATFWSHKLLLGVSFKDVEGRKVYDPIQFNVAKPECCERCLAPKVSNYLDGLVCVYSPRHYHAFVFNISTRQVVHLPKTRFDHESAACHCFLCFDQVDKEYKVLSIVGVQDQGAYERRRCNGDCLQENIDRTA